MKKLAPIALLLFGCLSTQAKDGYRIEVTFKQDVPDSVVYLEHYFGKHLPTVFRQDSAKVTGGRKAVFESRKEQLGGIFMIVYNKNSRLSEFLLNNGDHIGITIDNRNEKPGVLQGASFTGSAESERYQEYNKLMETLANRHKAITDKASQAKTKADTLARDKEYKALALEQADYRNAYVKRYPNTLLSNVFLAIKAPEPPVPEHYLEDGKTVDSVFTYQYMKAHYWDHFNFRDDRLIQTPIYDTKLNDYFSKWVYQIPDSINAEADKILTATKGTKELFRYTLRTLASNALQSKIMGMDEVFVHLVEQYYMKGAAYWLSDKDLEWYTERARKIQPNVLGNIAPDLNMQDVFTLKEMPLHDVKAKYTVLIIWSYDCGHCKKEVPLLDSVYRSTLKEKGVKIYSVASGGDLSEIQQFISNNKISEWINVADVNNNTGFREKYDAYTTPKVYLFDENKKIIGKGLDHSNINDVIEMTNRKARG